MNIFKLYLSVPKTDEYKVMFVGLGGAPMNIWAIRFDFDRLHIFVGGTMSPMNIHDLYSSVTWPSQ
jgi:hypothetical protein